MTFVTRWSSTLWLVMAGCGGATPTAADPTNLPSTPGAAAQGDAAPGANASPAAPAGNAGPCIAEVAAGDAFTCARKGDGSLWCWGLNADGQLGVGDAVDRWSPSEVSALGNGVAAIAAGASHACALLGDGSVRCWGNNDAGQLGDGTRSAHSVPAPVGGVEDALQIVVGNQHSCARRASGTVVCWGSSRAGQLGNGVAGANAFSATPVEVGGLPGADELAARGDHTCARSGEQVRCWGDDSSGQLGDGESGAGAYQPSPILVANLGGGAAGLTVGGAHSCARLSDGSVRCWGNNSSGQLGLGYVSYGSATAVPTPQALPMVVARALSAGQAHTCAIAADGSLQCWGVNGRGQLGRGDFTQAVERGVPTPSTVPLTAVLTVAAGATHTCARVGDGSLACWGGNRVGELGIGANDADLPSPTSVSLVCP